MGRFHIFKLNDPEQSWCLFLFYCNKDRYHSRHNHKMFQRERDMIHHIGAWGWCKDQNTRSRIPKSSILQEQLNTNFFMRTIKTKYILPQHCSLQSLVSLPPQLDTLPLQDLFLVSQPPPQVFVHEDQASQ